MSLTKIKSIIVDNDPINLKQLVEKLNNFIPEIEILGIALNGADGLQKIRALQPDLVFLDAELSDMTGFELLAKLGHRHFQTIFISPYVHYAIKALRFKALDYLLKPIDLGDLKNAVKRFKLNFAIGKKINHLPLGTVNINPEKLPEEALVLQTHDGELKIPLKNIVQIKGCRNYSYIYQINKKRTLISKTVGNLEERIENDIFFRCHKSHLININHIVFSGNGSHIKLSNGDKVPISRRKKERFKKWYSQQERFT
ncbi:MAG: LytTR family DNA-binding domain-containing protein [Bacteroidota bacterium]